MKFLVVGAGAVGGYFGGRLLEKGADVTFLVREGRRRNLQEKGLVIHSDYGNATLSPKTIIAGEEVEPYDVILLSTKAYHLDNAIDDVRPYVGENTMVIPLLNGMAHYNKLDEQFGKEKVIGGLCYIEATLDSEGAVIQKGPLHMLVYGERSGQESERIIKLADALKGTKADFQLSSTIIEDLWHKYLFIATMSGITTLMRAPIGPICKHPSGMETIKQLTKEIIDVMNVAGAPISNELETIQMEKIAHLAPEMKSSMQRDMEKGLPVEADHLHGYLLEIAKTADLPVPVLEAVYANLKIYERSR
ncbi:2-dehydropantoate 2-reductase [Caldibacillus thermoamylovorans]|uniref:2-dehydropantoate 2-reductase n=1 Tax=Caldibacillus thermoamylovorans TaxID=35841 RepID=A0ABD4A445_9BACI|nr:2-dehydropantoate 2-reductase [Caldibacillus thermoamylovorans]KIO68678.1 2-dehydropantoate 2-reductase [Caldibacillus thermoamylovorans]KIO71529.1 2-dehydropantoate 2-reductase [Caldibacillus thermoamylovorans]